MAKKKVLVGENRIVVSLAPYIHVGPGVWKDAYKRIHAPAVIDTVAGLQRRSGSLASPGIPARCYEATFVGNDMLGAPIYEAVRRLRLSAKDLDEVPEGSAPDIDDVIRYLAGDTEELWIAAETTPTP